MTADLTEKYPHLLFRTHWAVSSPIMFLLGQCQAYVKAICDTSILPENHQKLLNVSLVRGAHATTAIEGNTLTEEDIERIQRGHNLPPSRAYQEIEVRNVIDAYNELLQEVVYKNEISKITPDLIKRLHVLVSKGLGVHLDAIPGQFRTDFRVVGRYRCPDYADVASLVETMCDWLYREFNFGSGNQQFWQVVIQSIVAHVYLEWIHPFGDGNGRTGRLLEFYILLRGSLPDIASHIMANHYNNTRSEYYRQLDNARIKRDLTEFIGYALQGLHDGLEETLKTIQQSQFIITWHKYIYDRFADVKMSHKEVFKRRRELILSMPTDRGLALEELLDSSPRIARMYAKLSIRSINRDADELIKLGLARKESGRYFANAQLVSGFLAQKRN